MSATEVLDLGFRPINWARLDEVAPASPVIPGLLNKGEFGSLVGRAEAGKSLLALEISLSLALGTSTLGHPAGDPIAVMYIDMENSEAELADRLRRMGHAPSEIAGHPLHYFSFPDLPPLDTNAGGQQVALAAEDYEPQLIVLDTISRLVEGKEDSADTWRNLYNFTMVPLRRQGRTVLRLDHQGHDSSKGARGSSAKRDDVDVAWIMRRADDNVTLIRDKGRGLGHPERIVLRRHDSPTCHLPHGADDKLADCIAAMDALNVPLDTSRDIAASALRTNGHKFRNDVIGPALIARRSSASQGTKVSRDD